MSASSEKKKRLEERQEKLDRRAAAQREAEEKAQKSRLKWRLGTAALALFVILSIVLNTSLPFKMTAVKIGDTKYSAAEMSYFYTNAYYENAQYMKIFGVNFNQPLSSQQCLLMENGTWEDYLLESATASAQNLEALYQSAVAAGFELSEAGQANVDKNMEALPEYAEANGFNSVKKYLSAVYGTGVTEEVVRKLITKGNLVSEYTESVIAEYTYTDSELETYYADNIDKFLSYDVAYYLVAAETEETTDEEGNKTTTVVEGGKEAALETAQNMVKQITDRASFDAAVAAYKEDATVTEADDYTKSRLNAAYRDWATDASRRVGDTTAVETDSGAYVVMYLGMDDHLYPSATMRHILVMTEDADEDGSYSEEEKAAAKAKIEEIQKTWESGEQTEERFAQLANELSEDEGSNTTGGLYAGVGKGTMVSEIDQFLFGAKRSAGDTAIVHGNNGGYDGYHLVYYAGQGGSYHLSLANEAMVNDAYSAWQAEQVEQYPVTEGMGHNLIGK